MSHNDHFSLSFRRTIVDEQDSAPIEWTSSLIVAALAHYIVGCEPCPAQDVDGRLYHARTWLQQPNYTTEYHRYAPKLTTVVSLAEHVRVALNKPGGWKANHKEIYRLLHPVRAMPDNGACRHLIFA